MQHRAFTAIEALMTLGIIAVTTGVTIPVYRNYQIRSELMDATDQLLTAMRGAQLRARAGETAGTWGVYTVQGVLFQGDSFAERNPAYDEQYPLPPSVTVTGLEEVIFLPLSGLPAEEGEVLLTANNGDSRTILVGDQGTIAASGLSIPSVLGGGAEGDSSEGDDQGSTGSSASAGSQASEGVTSSSSSSAGSVASTASAATSAAASDTPPPASASQASTNNDPGQSASSADSSESSDASSSSSSSSSQGTTCEDRFYVGPDGSLETTGTVRATFKVLGSQITYGSGGPEVNVTVQASINGGKTWVNVFGGRDIDGGETDELTQIPSGSNIVIRVSGKHSWQFNRTYASNEGNGQIVVLRNGDRLPEYSAFDSQQSLASFLKPVVSGKKIAIGQYDAVYLTELGSLISKSADFQDAVLHVTFTQDAGCASSSATSSSSSAQSSSVATSAGSAASVSSQSASATSSSSSSSESGKKITICHFADKKSNTISISESAWKTHAEHGDRKGSCDGDDDDDNIDNAEDFCPGTKVENPKKYLLFFRNALTDGTSDIFRVGPTKKISSYTLKDTGGCSCEQLLDVAEGKPGYYFYNVPSAYLGLRSLLDSYVTTARKYGCSSDLLEYIELRIKK